MAVASSKSATGSPSIDTIVSPDWMPASSAGAAGADSAHSLELVVGTHSDSRATVVVAVCTPMPVRRIANSTIANRRFMTGPPSITTMRFQTGSR